MGVERAACLGPAGSYSELAAARLCPAAQIVLCTGFPAVFDMLEGGGADCAVIPIENSIQGGVLQNLDLLERRDAVAVAQVSLRIDHRLARREGVALSDITRVYSHEQAIGQCSRYLHEQLPRAQCVFTSSTAQSLSLLDAHSAGIVGAHIHAEGVVLSKENIADEKNNFTQFFLLRRRGEGLPSGGGTVFFVAVCEHRPGSLLALLEIFSSRGINLTRIESRPIPSVVGEYRFFIAIDGDIAQPQVREALSLAEARCRFFRILGVYDQTPKAGASSRQTSAARTP